MDCTKIGQLIMQLRKEKGLTQRQVAEKLHISNKTVSKWECGLGCPEASLWSGLSTILGVDIQKLLDGELDINKPDIGKMKQIRFYVCPSCGNILLSTGEASISCCGRKLHPLKAALVKEAFEITVEEMDMDYYIAFGHAMEKNHYISFAAYVFSDRVLLTRLYPEQGAEMRIPIMQSGGDLYLYCTEHGLQRFPKFL